MEICVGYPTGPPPTPPGKTKLARAAVPKTVAISKMIHNVGRAIGIAVAFKCGSVDDIGASMSDVIIEPARAFLIPGYQIVKEMALKAGACGVALSGDGPAMIAVVNTAKANSFEVKETMQKGFGSVGVDCDAFMTKPGKGVSIESIDYGN
jgi:homoserine kinase